MLDPSTHCDSKRSDSSVNSAQRAAINSKQRPRHSEQTAQWQARWREGCGGELARGSAENDTSICSFREPRAHSPSQWTQCAVMLNSPGRANAGTRDEPAGTRRRGSCAAGFGDGAEFNIMAIVSGDCPSKALPQARRHEHRQQCRSFMTAVPNEARLISRGRFVCVTLTTTRYTRQRVRAQRDSPFACLRCFSDRNGAQRCLRTATVFVAERFATAAGLVGGRTQAERSRSAGN
jgi:hypothetical protein